MGIAYLSFLYHHYTVVIQRAASHDQPKCLKSARQALSLLQEISPDPESVYNGVSWCVETQDRYFQMLAANEIYEGNYFIFCSHHSLLFSG